MTQSLASIYARIPKVKGCRSDCHDCCGPVPAAPAEARQIASPIALDDFQGGKITPTKAGCMTCAFSTSRGCSIYETRPIVCRLFGAVDHPRMTCPHGARSKRLLTDAQAKALIDEAWGMA